jgi:hypothetical protein
MNSLSDESYFDAMQDGIDFQQACTTELEQQLAEREKQIVMLRKSLLDAHNFIGDDVEAYETAKRRIDALAATDDLSGCILCDAEPITKIKHYDEVGLEHDIFLSTPLYARRK